MITIRRWPDARAFRARAEAWLLRAEAEHNLILGVVDELERMPSAYASPVYLATVEAAGEVVGCALRTPPVKLVLTQMPLAGADALVADVADVYPELPAVLGSEDVALRFGERWAALQGVSARVGARQRMHAADAVAALQGGASGSARLATPADLPLVTRWRRAFEREIGLVSGPDAVHEARLRAGGFWLWEDDGTPTSMAGTPARTPRWARIGYVYTPPERRKRGYAAALVADLTGRLLREGCGYAVLYTDLANPTSNAIYRRIGYRPVADVVDVLLEPPTRT